MHGNLLVPLDAEGSDSVLGLRFDGSLLSEIFKHLGSLGELIAGLTSAEIEDELLNVDVPHLVVVLFLLLLLVHIFFLSQLNLLIINRSRCLLLVKHIAQLFG